MKLKLEDKEIDLVLRGLVGAECILRDLAQSSESLPECRAYMDDEEDMLIETKTCITNVKELFEAVGKARDMIHTKLSKA